MGCQSRKYNNAAPKSSAQTNTATEISAPPQVEIAEHSDDAIGLLAWVNGATAKEFEAVGLSSARAWKIRGNRTSLSSGKYGTLSALRKEAQVDDSELALLLASDPVKASIAAVRQARIAAAEEARRKEEEEKKAAAQKPDARRANETCEVKGKVNKYVIRAEGGKSVRVDVAWGYNSPMKSYQLRGTPVKDGYSYSLSYVDGQEGKSISVSPFVDSGVVIQDSWVIYVGGPEVQPDRKWFACEL